MIRISFKHVLTAYTLIALICSCSNDNEPVIPEDNSSVNEEAIKDSLAYQTLLTNLCTVDTLEDGSLKYTLINGEVLYPQEPETYYIGVDSVEEAENMIKSTIIPIGQSPVETINGFTYDLLDASLSFQRIGSDFELASLDINIKELPDYKQIKFVDKEMWPDNGDTNASSPFTAYSVWKNNKTGYYYLCVRPAGYGAQGILLTFDGGWSVDPFRKYTHWQGNFDLYMNCGSSEAWNAVKDMQLYYPKKMSDIIKHLELYKSYTKLYNFMNAAYDQKGQTYVYNVGTHTYKHHLWWAYNCYDVTTYWYNLNTKNLGQSYYTHKSTPQNNIPNSCIYFSMNYNRTEWSRISQ